MFTDFKKEQFAVLIILATVFVFSGFLFFLGEKTLKNDSASGYTSIYFENSSSFVNLKSEDFSSLKIIARQLENSSKKLTIRYYFNDELLKEEQLSLFPGEINAIDGGVVYKKKITDIFRQTGNNLSFVFNAKILIEFDQEKITLKKQILAENE